MSLTFWVRDTKLLDPVTVLQPAVSNSVTKSVFYGSCDGDGYSTVSAKVTRLFFSSPQHGVSTTTVLRVTQLIVTVSVTLSYSVFFGSTCSSDTDSHSAIVGSSVSHSRAAVVGSNVSCGW